MSEASVDLQDVAPRTNKPAWHRLLKDPAAVAAAVFLLLVVGAALLAPLIAPSDPYASNLRIRLCPIGGARCPQSLLGTDQTGRDMVSRMLFGLRSTLMLGFTAVAIGGGFGATLGLLAAYYRRLDAPIMRFVDILLSFPPILFGLAIAAVIGSDLNGLVVALCVTAVPSIARISRGAGQQVMQQEYMEAGRAMGTRDIKLFWRYLAANTWPVIMIYMTLQLGQAILLGAYLSFVGLGAQPPTAELGSMASDGRKFLQIAPHVSTLPCALIFLLVLAFNVLGDALRDALDPQLRQ
jgi:ABC-type dipeptide/oligopeptide/nickel transport system permease subunit